MTVGAPEFSGGAIENLTNTPKYPEAGDLIRMGAKVTDSATLVKDAFHPCYLVSPSERRGNEYSALRAHAAQTIEKIGRCIHEQNWKEARTYIGALRTLELTIGEFAMTRELTGKIPSHAQPSLTKRNKFNPRGAPSYAMILVGNAYGVNLEGLTKEELVEFSRTALTGEIRAREKIYNSHLCDILRDFGVGSDIREKLMVDAIKARLPKIQITPQDELDDNRSVIRAAFEELVYIGTETSIQKALDYMVDFLNAGEYEKVGGYPPRRFNPSAFGYSLAASISGATRTGRIPIRLLTRNLRKLEATLNLLKKNDENPVVEWIGHIIEYTKQT